MKLFLVLIFLFLTLVSLSFTQIVAPHDRKYLLWTAEYALQLGKSMTENGRVGGFWDLRVKHTERSYNYKLRATWLTPDVIQANARYYQIKNRLTREQTVVLVQEAESVRDIVIMVEIDPRQGSGIIPSDWQVFLQPKGLRDGEPGAVQGVNSPKLRNIKALSGVADRDYDYDVFWLVFPLNDDQGKPVFSESTTEAELVVRIYGKEGRVSWLIPSSIRNQMVKEKMTTPQ